MSQQSRGRLQPQRGGSLACKIGCLLLVFSLTLGASASTSASDTATDRSSGDPTWMRRMADVVKSAVASTPHLAQILTLRDYSGEKPAGGQNCTTNSTCHHGTCMKEANATTADDLGHCVCMAGWMGETCTHEQKSLKTAFLLSFLLGNIGADRLYLGYVGSGVAKLLINLFLCVLPCCPLCYMCRSLSGGRRAHLAYGSTVGTLLVSAATVWLWWLIDWILIVTDSLPDDAGYPLFDNL